MDMTDRQTDGKSATGSSTDCCGSSTDVWMTD